MIEKSVGLHFFKVSDNFNGQRIDNFLRIYLKSVPKSMIYRIIRTGKIRVNKKRVQFYYKLKTGDLLKIPPIQKIKFYPLSGYNSQILCLQNSIIYEDDSLLILNKPSGIAVHGGSQLQFNVIDGLRILYSKAQFLELVHRLDRDTSGVLLIAKNRVTLTCLHRQLRFQQVQKEYLAIVNGSWDLNVTSILDPLPVVKAINLQKNNTNILKSSLNTKIAITRFRIRECFADVATFLQIQPITGRTHQIRIHTKLATHPIIGDKIYGNSYINLQFKKLGFGRLFLHASRLHFIHPFTKKILRIHAPIDQLFQDCLYFLKKSTFK